MNDSNSIQRLISAFQGKGFAMSNRFEVSISGKGAGPLNHRDLTPYIDSVTIPGRAITSSPYDLCRHTTEFPTGYANTELTMSFILDAEHEIKEEFEVWQEMIVNTKDYGVHYSEDYYADIEVTQLSRELGRKTRKMKFDNCYPATVSGQSYTNSAEGEVLKLDVAFNFNDLVYRTDSQSLSAAALDTRMAGFEPGRLNGRV